MAELYVNDLLVESPRLIFPEKTTQKEFFKTCVEQKIAQFYKGE